MSRSWALSPWVQVPFGLVFLLLGASTPWVFAENRSQVDALESGRACPAGTAVDERPDCLVAVPARVTEQRSRRGSTRYHLVPVDPTVRGEWVRFSDDALDGAALVAASGAPVEAVYAGDSVVAVDADGDRATTTIGEPGSDRELAWVGLALGSLGALALTGVWMRHRAERHLRGWDDLAPGPRRPEATPRGAALVSGVLVSVMLGGFGAAFAGSLQSELITFVAVAGPFVALLWRARRRAATRLQR